MDECISVSVAVSPFSSVVSNEFLHQTQSLSSRAKENLLQQQNLAELETLLAKAASVNAMMPLKGPKPTTPSDSSGDKRKRDGRSPAATRGVG
mgnify:CR=1 FL=1